MRLDHSAFYFWVALASCREKLLSSWFSRSMRLLSHTAFLKISCATVSAWALLWECSWSCSDKFWLSCRRLGVYRLGCPYTAFLCGPLLSDRIQCSGISGCLARLFWWLGSERLLWHGIVSIAIVNQFIVAVDIDALVFLQHNFEVKSALLFHDAVARDSKT